MPAEVNRVEKKKKEKKVIRLEKQTQEEPAVGIGVDPEDAVFSLDIGTRTVVGIVGVQENDKFRVLGAEVLTHKNRAMMDGQIHDIGQVAEIAREVKEKLEKKVGFPLTKVAIAAAGRVLKTCEVKVERDIDSSREIDQELISSIEIEGIQIAQMRLDEETDKDDKTQFYCVGYSVINYYLNNYVISTLVGHRGKKIGVEILATFLPHIVVDSLYTVMGKIGLEVISLTLEPIAAINVTIPKDLRLLNLALVDIGAGTSDIALTKDGSVVAYGMAPVAGDEITERIAQHYLVDFNTGEKIKISLTTSKGDIRFVDILGKKHTVKPEEVLEIIKPTVEFLALTIAQKILEFNHKAPNAVFLIGGGSQIPGLTELVAAQLKLVRDRVVVRGRDIINNIKFSGKKLSGPEAITPFGIAITALMQKGQDFLSVTINGKKIRLFNSKKLTVADALILIGFNPSQLIGRSGRSLTFELNGVKKVIRGEYGKAAEIYVNDQASSLDSYLKAGDDIRVVPAEDGTPAAAKAGEFIQYRKPRKIILNNTSFDIEARISINGSPAKAEGDISEGDRVEIQETENLEELLHYFEVDPRNCEILVNGKAADMKSPIHHQDRVDCKAKSIKTESMLADEVKEPAPPVQVAEENAEMKDIPLEPILETKGSRELVVTVNGQPTRIGGSKSQYIFVDIFNFINFDLSKPKGSIVLKLNGETASFTDPIKTGDEIDIYWDKLL